MDVVREPTFSADRRTAALRPPLRRRPTLRVAFALSILVLLVYLPDLASGELLTFTLVDPVGDAGRAIFDLVEVQVTFDNVSGDYRIILGTDPAAPFEGGITVALRFLNPDTPTFTRDPSLFGAVVSGCYLSVSTASIMLSGTETRLLQWKDGDRVASSSDSFGIPTDSKPGATIGSGVLQLP